MQSSSQIHVFKFISNSTIKFLSEFFTFSDQIHECEELQGTVASLKQQLSYMLEFGNLNLTASCSGRVTGTEGLLGEVSLDGGNVKSSDTNNAMFSKAKVRLLGFLS